MNLLEFLYDHTVYKIVKLSPSKVKVRYFSKLGMKIGKNCTINTMSFSTEPFLIEIGDNVLISSGTQFITHDGSVRCFKDEIQGGIFGKIKIGNNVNFGINCIVLYNTIIGNNCIIGAGSVVRGRFPDNSVIFGNPAKVVYNMSVQKMIFRNSKGFVKTNNLTHKESMKLVREHFGIE